MRFTRVCMCGQQTSGGAIDSTPWIGQAAGAGSEEGRTIFYDDGAAQEGDKLPVSIGPQGDKILALNESGNVPQAVPFTALRLGDGIITTVPGEPTVGTGAAIRAAVSPAIAGSGIHHVVIVGYAGDYLSYFTTPAEYEQQAYEGGFTLYGHYSSLVLQSTLTTLAKDAISGQPAPAPYPYDPNDGVHDTGAGYGPGSATATATAQPTAAVHLGHTAFGWTGGANGIDRPADRAFVTIQRAVTRHHRTRWVSVTDDLGMTILWSSDANGHYLAQWEVPLGASAVAATASWSPPSATGWPPSRSPSRPAPSSPPTCRAHGHARLPPAVPAQRLDLPPGQRGRRHDPLPRERPTADRARAQLRRLSDPAREPREHPRPWRARPLRQHQPERRPAEPVRRPDPQLVRASRLPPCRTSGSAFER